VLVEIGSVLLAQAWEQSGLRLVIAYARVLDLCVSTGKSTVRHSATVVARRAIRHVCRDGDNITALVTHLVAKDQHLGFQAATLLGVVAGVCARKNKVAFADSIPRYYAFCREILGSRAAVPLHTVPALADFLKNFVTAQDFLVEIVPTLERALLRAPETTQGLLPPIVQFLQTDLAKSLEALVKPLLANAKSNNANIRDGALEGFNAFISRSDKGNQALEKVAAELSSSLSKATAVDQRLIYAQMLGKLPLSTARPEVTLLAQVAGKEPNEAALDAEVSALTAQMSNLLVRPPPKSSTSEEELDTNSGLYKTIIEAFSKGLGDKKPSVKKIWVLSFGQFLFHIQDLVVQNHDSSAQSNATLSSIIESVIIPSV